MILETDRLALRMPTAADGSFLFRLMNEPDWIRFIGDRKITDVGRAEAYVKDRLLAMHEAHGFTLFTVELKSSAEPIGMCGLIQRQDLEAPDLGYAISESHAGRGYATEACRGVLDYARDELSLTRILGVVLPTHAASIRVLEKAGMEACGTITLSGEDVELSMYGTDL